MSYQEYWDQIFVQGEKLNSIITSYWRDYSSFGNWQFWVVILLLVAPLILLYFTVDRSQVFHLFFFGYTVHLLWSYIDIVLERYSILIHTYFIAPVFPYAINMTASAIPVAYLLLYQYCLNHNKNFFIYSLFLGAIMAFGFAPIEMFIGMMKLSKGMNLLYLFFIDVAIGYAAYFFTKIVRKLSRNELFLDKS